MGAASTLLLTKISFVVSREMAEGGGVGRVTGRKETEEGQDRRRSMGHRGWVQEAKEMAGGGGALGTGEGPQETRPALREDVGAGHGNPASTVESDNRTHYQ